MSKQWHCLLVKRSLSFINPWKIHYPNHSKFVSKTNMKTIIAYSNCTHSLLRTPAIYHIHNASLKWSKNFSPKRDVKCLWTYTVAIQRQDSVDQTLTSLSSPADTKSFPFAPYLIPLIESLCEAPPDSSTKVTAQSSLPTPNIFF